LEELNMADLYYCIKCKIKTEMKDAKPVIMKNNKPALKGQCAVCGTNIHAIVGKHNWDESDMESEDQGRDITGK
jgi:hypothetical protein